MRPSHLIWILIGIFSTCDAASKSSTSSSNSHSHKTSASTLSHSFEIRKYSTTPSIHIRPSSRSFETSKTPSKSKTLLSTSKHAPSTTKHSKASKSLLTSTKSKSTVHRAESTDSSSKSRATHKATSPIPSIDHRSSSLKEFRSKTSQKQMILTSTSHHTASYSLSSSSLLKTTKSSEDSKILTSPTASASEKSTSQHSAMVQALPLPSISSKRVTFKTPQITPVASKLSQTSITSISLNSHENGTQKTNKSSINKEKFPISSVALRKANITQAMKSTHTITSSSNHSISPSELAKQASLTNKTGPCTDGTFVDASCFRVLNLSEYLVHWWATNEVSCNSKNAPFARCFYALETPYGPSDCAQMNDDAACTQPLWNDFKNAKNGIQNFYVAWNLWNTAGLFLDLWIAIGAAEASSQAGLASIVTLLDPPQNGKPKMEYVLDALSFGLSLYAEGSIFMKALLRSAPQGYGLSNKLFQRGTVNSEYQDWSIISANLGKYTDIFRATVAQELPLVQNNLTAFLQWSEISGLSGYRPPLQGLAENMTQTLNTYAIARILDTQGIVVSRAPNTDVHALQTNGSQLNWDTGCGDGYDSLGVCDTFFWDGVDTYGLTDPLHFTKNYHDELESLFSPKDNAPSLTTGRLLFSGAQSCYQATGQNGGAPPLLDPTDASRIVCLSNVAVCTWDESGYGPFDSSCKNLPDRKAPLFGFGASGCRDRDNSIFSIDVPRAYLGPGIYKDAKNIDELTVDTFCDDVDF